MIKLAQKNQEAGEILRGPVGRNVKDFLGMY
jgi:hypothetical protein